MQDVTSSRLHVIDNARFLVQVLVFYGHAISRGACVGTWPAFLEPLHTFIILIDMPVFAFISGLLSQGHVTPKRVRATFQGVLLPWLLCGLLRRGRGWPIHGIQPINVLGAYWYLGSLTLWRMSVPMMQLFTFRFTISCAFLLNILRPYFLADEHNSYIRYSFEFLPFFVCGMHTPREWLVALERRPLMRAASLAVLLASASAWLALAPLTSRIDLRAEKYDEASTLRAKLSLLPMVCVWAAAALCACPHGEYFFTGNGARSLYSYVLHLILLEEMSNWDGACIPTEPAWVWMVAAPAIFLATYVLTSRPVAALFWVVVEPRWVGCLYGDDERMLALGARGGHPVANNEQPTAAMARARPVWWLKLAPAGMATLAAGSRQAQGPLPRTSPRRGITSLL